MTKILKFLFVMLLCSSFTPITTLWKEKKVDKHKILVIYIGDSITEGSALDNRAKDAPPVYATDMLQEMVAKEDTTYQVVYSNQGHSGATTLDFLPGTKYYQQVVAGTKELIAAGNGRLVFSIMLGTNDSAIKGTHGAPVSSKSYYDNLELIINHLMADFPDALFILQHPLWYSTNTYNNAAYLEQGLERLKQYSPVIKSLVTYYAKKDAGRVFEGDKKGFAYFKANHLTDMLPQKGQRGTFYLHPNAKGSQELGRFWAATIFPQLGLK